MNRPFVATAAALLASTVATSASAQPGGAPAELPSAMGASIEVGGFAAQRHMELRVDGGELEHAPGVYPGAMVRADVRLLKLPETDAALHLEAEYGFGARKDEPSLALGRSPVTQVSLASARLGLQRELSAAWALRVSAGASGTSFVIERNPDYTGHRYVSADAAVGIEWRAREVPWSVSGQAAALGALDINQSSGGYGEARGFGARAELGLGWGFWSEPTSDGYRGARLTVRYRHQRYRALFPERRVRLGGGVSVDQQHFLIGSVGYHF